MIIWLLAGCRAKLETSRQESHQHSDEIGVELRRVDSLWSSIAERFNMKIEFYPPSYFDSLSTTTLSQLAGSTPIAPTATNVGNTFQTGSVGGGIGAIKSIEITTENEATTNSASHVDSTYSEKSDTTETLQKEAASEAKQDNGTIIGLAVVLGLVVIAVVWLFIKTYLKK